MKKLLTIAVLSLTSSLFGAEFIRAGYSDGSNIYFTIKE